jgi:hypothetical protein
VRKKVETAAVVMSKVGGDRIDLGSCEVEVYRGLIETEAEMRSSPTVRRRLYKRKSGSMGGGRNEEDFERVRRRDEWRFGE